MYEDSDEMCNDNFERATVNMSPELAAQVREFRKQHGGSISAALRFLVVKGLQSQGVVVRDISIPAEEQNTSTLVP